MKKKKIILSISSIMIILILVIGISIAAFSYNTTGENRQLVVGDIYMHYRETTTNINIGSIFPSNNYINGEYFEFTIDGKNTNTKGNILYNIQVTKGDNVDDKVRIADKFLKFRLVKVENNQEIELANDKNYEVINNTIIYSDMINKETNSEIEYTYRLYVWISDEVEVGNTEEVDYTTDEWNKLFASVKVNVNGKYIEGELLTNTIKSKLGTGGVVAVNTDGELYNANDSTQEIREYRYSGGGNYCTYTDGANDYKIQVESDSCSANACLVDGQVMSVENDLFSYYAAEMGVESVSCSDVGGTSISLKGESIPTDSGIRNYVEFNNELWRIVGLFNNEIKLVKNIPLLNNIYESDTYIIDNLTYQLTEEFPGVKYQYFNYNVLADGVSKNDWATSGVMHYLNDETENSYYTNHLSIKAKNLITETTYYLGNFTTTYVNSDGVTAIESYEDERESVVCDSTITDNTSGHNCNIWYGNASTWLGKIGLLYPSDYGYASSSEYWNNTPLHRYNEIAYQQNWMYDNIGMFIHYISPSDYRNNYTVFGSADIGSDSNTPCALRPVVTLKSDVIVIDGDGSYQSPYKLLEG